MSSIPTCTWSHDEQAMGSVGAQAVSFKTLRHWTPSPLDSGRLLASLPNLVKSRNNKTGSALSALNPSELAVDWPK